MRRVDSLRLRKTLALAFVLLPFFPIIGCAESSITPDMDRYLMEGLDAIYRMDFDGADAAAQKVIELNPEHPYGYFALASTAWTRYVYETEQTDQTLIAPIEKKMAVVLEKSHKWLKKHPKDAYVLMIEGSAYGLSSRLLCMRHEWLKAYWYGRKAVNITRAAIKADPDLYDAYLGIGMYDYYTDVYQKVVGVLAKVLFGGDRARGIKTLQLVAEKGRYSKVAAQLLLVEIYNTDPFGAANPQEAVKIMKEIRPRYPDSAMLFAAELVSLYEAKRYEEVLEGAQVYLQRVKEGKYRPIELAKGSVIYGTALWALKQREKALGYLKTAAEVKLGDQLSRWAVWSLIRAGQLQDLLGKREDAIKDYKAAAALPDYWGMRAIAKANLAKPFARDDHPGPIQSPD